jgi:predicted nucleotidyltransferase component of viral defense system
VARNFSQPARPVTREGLLLWIIHRFAIEFEEHAIIKGGMALRLLDSPRFTNDIDYVFVPYASKKDILPAVRNVLDSLVDARIHTEAHSTMIRSDIYLDDVAVQVEVSVSQECQSLPMATASIASDMQQPSQIVRIQHPNVALAHKLAAWNERRLVRDLFDAYFLVARVGATVDLTIFNERLNHVRSRLPKLRAIKRMTLSQFADDLQAAVFDLNNAMIDAELLSLIPDTEGAGLALRMRATLTQLVDHLKNVEAT